MSSYCDFSNSDVVCLAMLKLSFLALCAALLAPPYARAQSSFQSTTPARNLAVGTMAGQSFLPTTVEVSSDGWVVVSNYPAPMAPSSPQLSPPNARVLLEPREVKRFLARAQTAFAIFDSIARNPQASPRDQVVTLGDGPQFLQLRLTQARTEPLRPPTQPRPGPPTQPTPGAIAAPPGQATWTTHIRLETSGCTAFLLSDGNNRQDVAEFLALLDTAATRATKRLAVPRPPTLRRPYYAGEVSCVPQLVGTVRRPVADGIVPGTEVAAEFVVDTSGVVEPNSIRFLPSTGKRAVAAARVQIERRRYTPADWDGTPVRAVVQATVVFGPEPPRQPFPPTYSMYGLPVPLVFIDYDSAGFVKLTATLTDGRSLREWFDADSVDIAVSELRRQLDSARANATDSTRQQANRPARLLGHYPGPQFTMMPQGRGKALVTRAGFGGCSPGLIADMTQAIDTLLIKFTNAAESARRARGASKASTPAVYAASDVACPVEVSYTLNPRMRLQRIQHYPVATYPSSHFDAGRFDAIFAVTVDSAGIGQPESVEVMPDTPPWVQDAVRESLHGIRYRPAIRGGMNVAQRMIQILRFEPTPICEDAAANPSCPRRYSDR